jgi:hypothetical protein
MIAAPVDGAGSHKNRSNAGSRQLAISAMCFVKVKKIYVNGPRKTYGKDGSQHK